MSGREALVHAMILALTVAGGALAAWAAWARLTGQ